VVLVEVSQLIPARCSAVHETGIRALVAAVLPELREVGLAVMVPPTRVVVGADRILVQLAVPVALVVLVAAVVEEAERTVTGMVELAALVVAHRSRFGCSDEMVRVERRGCRGERDRLGRCQPVSAATGRPAVGVF